MGTTHSAWASADVWMLHLLPAALLLLHSEDHSSFLLDNLAAFSVTQPLPSTAFNSVELWCCLWLKRHLSSLSDLFSRGKCTL